MMINALNPIRQISSFEARLDLLIQLFKPQAFASF